jgi:putative sigma-54 modulation protein
MQLNVAFRHMDPSIPLKEYVEKKTSRFAKLSGKILEVQVTYEQEKLDTIVELLTTLHGYTIKANERGNDPYAATDLALDKFERQIVKVRNRLRDRNKQGITKDIVVPAEDEEAHDEVEIHEEEGTE